MIVNYKEFQKGKKTNSKLRTKKYTLDLALIPSGINFSPKHQIALIQISIALRHFFETTLRLLNVTFFLWSISYGFFVLDVIIAISRKKLIFRKKSSSFVTLELNDKVEFILLLPTYSLNNLRCLHVWRGWILNHTRFDALSTTLFKTTRYNLKCFKRFPTSRTTSDIFAKVNSTCKYVLHTERFFLDPISLHFCDSKLETITWILQLSHYF